LSDGAAVHAANRHRERAVGEQDRDRVQRLGRRLSFRQTWRGIPSIREKLASMVAASRRAANVIWIKDVARILVRFIATVGRSGRRGFELTKSCCVSE
jgi:hypothetical protein